jgi:glycosyltransferase involved in cell wall biosynthesis
MNICLVTQYFPPDTGGGGIASYAQYLAQGLRARGHSIRVISRLAPNSKPFANVGDIEIYRIVAPLQSHRWSRLPILGRHIRFFRDLVYAWRIRKLLLRMRAEWLPDIVEYADIDAEGLFHPAYSRRVVKLHSPHKVMRPFYSRREAPYAWKGIEALESMSIKRANGISSPSNWLAQEVGRLEKIPIDDIKIVLNAIDTDLFSPAPTMESKDRPLILYVGRLEPRKGATVFAQAIPKIAAQFADAQFAFLGADRSGVNGTSQREDLCVGFKSLGLLNRVQFHGHDSPAVYLDYYRRASVFVMPSLFENCPYTLLEAMACGKAVVVSDASGMAEMVDHGRTGIKFEAGNSNQLANATIELLESPEKCRTLGEAARTDVLNRFSVSVVAEATEKFYQSVLSPTKGGL